VSISTKIVWLAGLLAFASPTFSSPKLQTSYSAEGIFSATDLPDGIAVRFNLSSESEASLCRGSGSQADSTTSSSTPIIRWVALPPTGQFIASVVSAEYSAEGLSPASPLSTDLQSKLIHLGKPVILRGVRMAPLIVNPQFRDYLGNRGIVRSLELTIEKGNDPGENEVLHTPHVFSPVYRSLLETTVINPDSPNLPRRDPAPANFGKMLILIPEAYQDEEGLAAIEEFAEWKRRCGLEVTSRTIDAVGLSSREIRDIIAEGYPDDPYDYVVIIGWDRSYDVIEASEELQFPSFEMSDHGWGRGVSGGDLFYATLDIDEEDSDLMPDVMIGRMIVPTTASLHGVLNRSILYEREPYPGGQGHVGEWFGKALFACDHNEEQFQRSATDMEMWAWIQPRMARMGMSLDTVFNNFEDAAEQERRILEQGISVAIVSGNFTGATSLADPRNNARTNGTNPFIVSGGTWFFIPTIFPFFASATLQRPDGPIATITQLSYCEEHRTRFTNASVVKSLSQSQTYRVGELFLSSIAENLANMNELLYNGDSADFREYLHNYSVFGDPSVQIYTATPPQLQVILASRTSPGATSVNIRVTDDNADIPGAAVCIRQPGHFQYVLESDANGSAAFTVPEGLAEGRLQVTVHKHNYRAAVEDIPVSAEEANIILTSGGFNDRAIGDGDGLLRNGERVELAVAFQNTGEAEARNSTAVFSTSSPFLHFLQNDVPLEDLAAGAEGGLREPIDVRLDPNCPGGNTIRVQVDVTSEGSEWNSAFELITSGSRYAINPDGIDAQNLLPDRNGTISPALSNIGDLDGEWLTATLVSLTDGVTVNLAEERIPAVPVGASRPPVEPFRVSVDRLFIPGQRAEFELRLSGEHEGERTVRFSIPISAPEADDPIGPDSYGYICYDSGDTTWPDAPKYNWIEINPSLNNHELLGQDLELEDLTNLGGGWEQSADNALIDLPFSFRYYGQDYDKLVVCSNGWVSFDTNAVQFRSPYNAPIPGGVAPNAQICLCWQDILTDLGQVSGFYSYYYRDAGIFIVEWSEVYLYGDTLIDSVRTPLLTPVSFQLQLYDPQLNPTPTGDGEIVIQYQEFHEIKGYLWQYPFATIGVRSPDGSDGIQYAHRGRYNSLANPITNEFAVKFTTAVNVRRSMADGAVFRTIDHFTPVEGARVYHPRGIDCLTDAQGRFVFNARMGFYPNVQISKGGFNTISLDLTIADREFTDLGDFIITSPNLLHIDPITFDLRPDGARTHEAITLVNLGNGSLEYSAGITYADGSETSFDTLRTFPISALLQRPSSFSPVWLDSLFYIPYMGEQVRSMIGRMTKNGVLRAPIGPLNIDSSDAGITSLAWDGRRFWGSASNFAGTVHFYEIDLNGQIGRTITPSGQVNDYSPSPLVYCPDDTSLINAVRSGKIQKYSIRDRDFGSLIDERDLDVRPIHLLPRGLGWNRDDPDGLPLYIMNDLVLNDSTSSQLLIRANPDTREAHPWGLLPGNARRAAYGAWISTTFDRTNLCLIVNQNTPGLRDTLKVYKLGPNTSFLTNGLENRVGVVGARSTRAIGMSFDATGWPVGTYSFGVRIAHNAVGGQTFVPVSMIVRNDAGAGGSDIPLPAEFGIKEIYPNPFNSTVSISYALSAASHVKLTIHDLTGREVIALVQKQQKAGFYRIHWDGKNEEGDQGASGLYFVRLETPAFTKVNKMMLVK